MSTLTELITEHRITATNPFATPRESDEAAVRMAKALEAVVEVLAEVETTPGLHRITIGRRLREAITAALTETKGDGRG